MPDSVLDNFTWKMEKELRAPITRALFFIMDDIGGGDYKEISQRGFKHLVERIWNTE